MGILKSIQSGAFYLLFGGEMHDKYYHPEMYQNLPSVDASQKWLNERKQMVNQNSEPFNFSDNSVSNIIRYFIENPQHEQELKAHVRNLQNAGRIKTHEIDFAKNAADSWKLGDLFK
jgi:hypothetical protein